MLFILGVMTESIEHASNATRAHMGDLLLADLETNKVAGDRVYVRLTHEAAQVLCLLQGPTLSKKIFPDVPDGRSPSEQRCLSYLMQLGANAVLLAQATQSRESSLTAKPQGK